MRALHIRGRHERADRARITDVALPAGSSASTSGDGLISDLRKLSRSVLLAFADLGIYLPSDRETIIAKARGLDPQDANDVAEFLGLCIDAGLITRATADRLILCPDEAKRLAHSLDGHTPVPDEQATAWAKVVGSSV
jgi:hypothetical protein